MINVNEAWKPETRAAAEEFQVHHCGGRFAAWNPKLYGNGCQGGRDELRRVLAKLAAMPNKRLELKFDDAVSRENRARAYRVLASAMITDKSRDRLLHMAEMLESHCRTPGDEAASPDDSGPA